MAGILDSKERMIDFIITPQGRSQIGDGRMRIEYVTLTDVHSFYTSSREDLIADDASSRLYFECHSSHTDMITPEIAPGNITKPFRAGAFLIDGKTIAEGTFPTGDPVEKFQLLSGSAVTEKAELFTNSLSKHFQGLRILRSEDSFSNSSDFFLGASTGSFAITSKDLEINGGKGIYLKDLSPYLNNDETPDGKVDLRKSVSIYADPRFAHFPNFRYLPPVNVQDPSGNSEVLGAYPKINKENESVDPLMSLSYRQKLTVNIEEISKFKNIFGQVFQFSEGSNGESSVDKLSIVDYGVRETTNGPRHYFFLGKLYRDEEGVDTFINIFTLEFFENDSSKISFLAETGSKLVTSVKSVTSNTMSQSIPNAAQTVILG